MFVSEYVYVLLATMFIFAGYFFRFMYIKDCYFCWRNVIRNRQFTCTKKTPTHNVFGVATAIHALFCILAGFNVSSYRFLLALSTPHHHWAMRIEDSKKECVRFFFMKHVAGGCFFCLLVLTLNHFGIYTQFNNFAFFIMPLSHLQIKLLFEFSAIKWNRGKTSKGAHSDCPSTECSISMFSNSQHHYIWYDDKKFFFFSFYCLKLKDFPPPQRVRKHTPDRNIYINRNRELSIST